jgi:type IV secretory pathway ATPase VirB11/archaellum biosynthesis ATPase
MTDNNHQNEEPQYKSVHDRRQPKILQSVTGARISLEALLERIVEQFNIEHGDDSPVFKQAETRAQRMKLVSEVTKYIFAVESLQLMPSEQADIIHRVYGEIYGYGPLDPLLADERVTTISLEGVDKASVRYGPSEELTVLDSLFTDNLHLNEIVRRILRDARATYIEGMAFIEVGMTYNGRKISINIAFPPFTLETTVDIRVHPEQMPSLDDLVESEFMSEDAATLLRALIQSQHGMVIMGEPESGKTTLLSAMTQEMKNLGHIVTAERTGEICPPDNVNQRVVRWGYGDDEPIWYEEHVRQALKESPHTLILDEITADQAQAINLPLTQANAPRQIWAFRGGTIIKRIRSAITMVAQRANPSDPNGMERAVYERLPFVILTKRNKAKKKLQLLEIIEWQYINGSEYPDLISLMEQGWFGIEVSGRKPQRDIDLPDSFWEK